MVLMSITKTWAVRLWFLFLAVGMLGMYTSTSVARAPVPLFVFILSAMIYLAAKVRSGYQDATQGHPESVDGTE